MLCQHAPHQAATALPPRHAGDALAALPLTLLLLRLPPPRRAALPHCACACSCACAAAPAPARSRVSQGFEIGSGFSSTKMTGSAHNDEFYMDDGAIRTRTNR